MTTFTCNFIILYRWVLISLFLLYKDALFEYIHIRKNLFMLLLLSFIQWSHFQKWYNAFNIYCCWRLSWLLPNVTKDFGIAVNIWDEKILADSKTFRRWNGLNKIDIWLSSGMLPWHLDFYITGPYSLAVISQVMHIDRGPFSKISPG